MKALISVLITLFLAVSAVAFPIVFWWQGANSPILFYLPWIMAALWAVKGLLQKPSPQRYFSFCLALILVVIAGTRALVGMFWYPVIINGLMFALFASSLWQSQTFVERLARLQEPNLTAEGVRYTRTVTQVWCVVFIINIVITSALIFGQYYDYWALYSGVISYVFIGLVMGIEWIIRQQVKKHHAN
ncbi:hypothetical protein C3007_06410 [Avibacterium gallinarum]|uniref:Membrane protein n=1 Tax=Avibacterium gallinarum TaxID=755 RepID=A0A379AZQ6_AVIGA|nr:hypothetical protein [Avibacterium gallinarum]POY44216.1 hypothetical protein C3007_06410 [Avibacterium gallinarum]TDP29255.1 putative membrane protein [Avibacterium gallinarum]SUB28218.1 Predicted membrane protein [Avibacterium gallinarum]